MATVVSPTSATPTYAAPYASRQAAQVHQLRQQGESPSQIAAILDLSTAAVDRYLGITPSTAGSVPTAALTPASARGAVTAPVISVFG
jgi:hypothetical protein